MQEQLIKPRNSSRDQKIEIEGFATGSDFYPHGST
jgi:hypothetical protein